MSDDLIQAAFEGDVEQMARLLDDGADIDGNGQGLWNALHSAIENGRIDAVRLLVRRGADIHRSGGGLSPLAHAVDVAIDGTWQTTGALGTEATDTIDALLDAGADPEPGLEMARQYESRKVVDFLTRRQPIALQTVLARRR